MTKRNSKSAAVERALAVLDTFEIHDRYLTLAEIAIRTKIAKATLLRILPSLNDHRLVCRAEDGTYFVGPASLRLSTSHNATVRSGRIIIPILSQLVERTGETASYSIRQGDFLLYIHRKNSPRRLRAHIQTGDISPLEKSAPGQVIAAFEKRSNQQYASIRRQMFAVTSGEMDQGIASISCPVFDHEDEIVGALSLHGPESRINESHISTCTAELLKLASKITADFGGRTEPFTLALKLSARDDSGRTPA
jgi:DNA-binding IclR family transcriptional regulator